MPRTRGRRQQCRLLLSRNHRRGPGSRGPSSGAARGINKERNEPPDIDIDFEHERHREEVIQYLYARYNREPVFLDDVQLFQETGPRMVISSTWTFTGSAGVAETGGDYDIPAGYDEEHVAFLDGSSTGSMSQGVYLTPGTYEFNFQMAERSGDSQGVQVYIGATNLGTYDVPKRKLDNLYRQPASRLGRLAPIRSASPPRRAATMSLSLTTSCYSRTPWNSRAASWRPSGSSPRTTPRVWWIRSSVMTIPAGAAW